VINNADTSLEVLGITREQYNWLTKQNPSLKSCVYAFSAEPEEGISRADAVYFLMTNLQVTNSLTSFLVLNNNVDGQAFVKDTITQMVQNPGLVLDVNASSKSPFNIDKLSITNATPEGAKFNAVYDALTKSPEFKTLFTDLFDNNQGRFNVKFEIADNLDKNGKEINGDTTLTDDKNLVIRINKQILTTTGTRLKTNIEIARTILHEAIHAYLIIKGKNPTSPGLAIPGIENMTLEEVINAIYPVTNNIQHEFMYTHMVPTMKTILTQIRDLLTTPARRSDVESLSVHPTTTPLTSITWSWNDYFKYLSLVGLEETKSFKTDFPNPSDSFSLYVEYVKRGHEYLDNKLIP
jgi:hypothetical protein